MNEQCSRSQVASVLAENESLLSKLTSVLQSSEQDSLEDVVLMQQLPPEKDDRICETLFGAFSSLNFSDCKIQDNEEKEVEEEEPAEMEDAPKCVIVEWTQMVALFRTLRCQNPNCCKPIVKSEKSRKAEGVAFSMTFTCVQGHKWSWASSQKTGSYFSLNVSLSAAILVCGGSNTTVSEIADTLGLAFPHTNTLIRHQTAFVNPTIETFYDKCQSDLVRKMHDKRITVTGIEIKGIVTDRSPSVTKLLREKFPEILHHYDPWHITKAEHDWGEGRCEHDELDDEDDEYFTITSPGYEEIKDIVLKPRLLQQLEKTTHFFFTSALEAYHSLILKYSTKRIHFPYSGMRARSQMSILDHNLNLGRKQAVNKKTGELRFNRKWSKKTKQWIVTPVLEPKKYDFRKKICTMVMEEAACTDRLVECVSLRFQESREKFKIPKNVVSKEGPTKEVLVTSYMDRKRKSDARAEDESSDGDVSDEETGLISGATIPWIPLKSLTLATSRQQAWYVGSSIPHFPHLQTLGGKRVAGSSEEVPRVSPDV
ncbi:unnamed protein product [Cyprideis torosa]|uniref:Transposase n=1 Tax=Cyprideis torosa TaxID=163714 RepID=A0A7R8WKR5_9CRUS|nr:unnamed protein product [Cyprideis torosa]CAG0903502.1 unnamed protein product [Cyprideis torosa]